MIEGTLTGSLAMGVIPAQTKLPEAAPHGDNAFAEALAGAHTVRDQREASAAQSGGRERVRQDQVDRTSDADEARSTTASGSEETHASDHASETGRAHSASTDTAARAQAKHDDDADASADATTGSDASDATQVAVDANADAAQATAAATSAAGAANVAAPVAADLQVDAPVVATTQVSTDAVDAAMRLAIDAGSSEPVAASAPAAATNAAEATNAGTEVAAAAVATTSTDATQTAVLVDPASVRGTEDADAGDATGPTRSLASTLVAASGPEPAQAGSLEAGATAIGTSGSGVTTGADATSTVVADDTAAQVQVVAETKVDAVATGTQGQSAQLTQAAVESSSDDVAVPTVDVEATSTADTADVAAETGQARAAATVATEGDDASVQVAARDAALADAGADASDPAATPKVVQPATAQQQAAAAIQAKAQEQAADDAAAESPAQVAKVDAAQPATSTATQPTTPRTEVAPAARGREVAAATHLQERIDHIADQLATRLRLSHAAGGSHVNLSLRPRDLGDVTVRMQVREGVVAATVLVENTETLQTLQSNLDDLRRSLENQGLSIQEFSVDVRGEAGAAGTAGRQDTGRRSGRDSDRNGASSVAGALAATPGLTGDREVHLEDVHDGDVSVLA